MPDKLKINAVTGASGGVAVHLSILDENLTPYPEGKARVVILATSDVLAITEDGGLTTQQKIAAIKQLCQDEACSWMVPETYNALQDVLELIPDLPVIINLSCP